MRSGDLIEPAELVPGEQWTFTINEGEKGTNRRISVNYDGFVHDVSVGDVLLVDGGIMTFKIKEVTDSDVVCIVCHPARPIAMNHCAPSQSLICCGAQIVYESCMT